MKSNNMPSKIWGEIIYPFSNFNGYKVEVMEMDKKFHPTLYNGFNYLSMLNLNHVPVAPFTNMV